MTDRIPTITAEVPTKFDTFVARTTEIDGRTFSAHATEFNDHGQPVVERIMLNIHHSNTWERAEARNRKVHCNVVCSQVSIDIGDLCVWLPEGTEVALLEALTLAIAEQARQAETGTDDTVVQIDAGWVRELDEVTA